MRAKLAVIAKVDRARALLHRFRRLCPACESTLEVFPRETHMSVLAIAIDRAVQAAFACA